ncbi:MAG: hypothetical protein MMC33_002924 [Icmadophila ericetorum]|nr:hypothetical protein [Icmadophila ericetorum]
MSSPLRASSMFFGLLCCLVSFTYATTVTYDFNITWVTASPDGFSRPVIGINGQWPIPTIIADIGDRIVINVLNLLGNQTTSLHFHGIYMKGTSNMDGVTGLSQCPILPGASLTYNFTVNQPGTYWYHSHDKGQYPDGLRGPMIIHDQKAPFDGQYNEEIFLTVSDWYHTQVPDLLTSFINVANPTGAEPIPDAALLNDSQNLSVPVLPGKTYLVHLINMGAFAGQYIWFEGHDMTIVEVDGIYTEPAKASMLYLTAAQRYTVLITMNNDTSSNFPFSSSMDTALFDHVPESLNPNVTGWLVYNPTGPLPNINNLTQFAPYDDYTLVPYDHEPLAFFNGITYIKPKVPTLYTALSTGPAALDSTVYGTNTHALVLGKNDVVEIILNNMDTGKHPFHLHGHAFQAVWRSEINDGLYGGNGTFPQFPIRRDVFMVNPLGNIVLRFVANNAGVWFFHCHIEWHLLSGLAIVFIEDPLTLQETLTIPAEQYEMCADQNIPTAGNAAGNTQDFFDLTGQNLPPPPLPAGFTPRGIVALVFSCISAVVGMAAIVWYGIGEISTKELAAIKKMIAESEASSSEISVPTTDISSKHIVQQDSIEIFGADVGSSTGREL